MKFLKISVFSLFLLCTFSIQCSAEKNQIDILDKLAQGIIINSIWRIQANEHFQKTIQDEAEKSIKTTLNINELNDTQKHAALQIVEILRSIPEEILLNPSYMTQANQILMESLSSDEIQELDHVDQQPNPNTYIKLADAELKILELGSTYTQQTLTDPLLLQKVSDKAQVIIQQLDKAYENKQRK